MADMELTGVNLPYSLDAEQSVLGAILLDGSANMPKASAKLHPEHFYVKMHSDIYTVMTQMFAASDSIDVVTVLENCMKQNVFESQEEGRTYLVKLMETVPSISSIDRYIEIVEDKYTRRQLISIAGDILENANEGQAETATLLELAEKKIYSDIAAQTGASTATISRVNKCLNYGNDGYNLVIGRLKEQDNE